MSTPSLLTLPLLPLPAPLSTLTSLLTLFLLLSTTQTLYHALYNHYRALLRQPGPNAPRNRRIKREVVMFLLLAGVAFAVVNATRWGMRDTVAEVKGKLKVGMGGDDVHLSAADIAALPWGVRTALELVVGKSGLKDGVSSSRSVNKVTKYMVETVSAYHAYDVNESIWTSFRMNVATPTRTWWTGQWVMGYAAWAMFVGINARNRDISRTTIAAFIIMGYLVGLAGTQCIFYALLCIKPRILKQRIWVIEWWGATALLVSQAVVMLLLPIPVELGSKGTLTPRLALFGVMQTYLMVLPVVMHTMSRYPWPGWTIYGRPWPPSTARMDARGALRSFWWVMSHASLLLYLSGWGQSWMQTAKANKSLYSYPHILAQFGLTEHDKASVWQSLAMSSTAIFSGLRGWNPWVRALAYDVILSGLGLVVWTVVSQKRARTIAEIGLGPWLEESADDHHQAGMRLGDAATEMFGKAGRGWSNIHADERQGCAAMRDAGDERIGYDYDIPDYYRRPFSARSRSRIRRSARDAAEAAAAAASERPRSASRGPKAATPTRRRGRKGTRARARERERSPSLPAYFNYAPLLHDGKEGVLSMVEYVMYRVLAAGVTVGLCVVGGLGMGSNAVYGAEE